MKRMVRHHRPNQPSMTPASDLGCGVGFVLNFAQVSSVRSQSLSEKLSHFLGLLFCWGGLGVPIVICVQILVQTRPPG
eukprot:6460713-Amphidinium_carterae.2